MYVWIAESQKQFREHVAFLGAFYLARLGFMWGEGPSRWSGLSVRSVSGGGELRPQLCGRPLGVEPAPLRSEPRAAPVELRAAAVSGTVPVDGITDSMDLSPSKFQETVVDREAWRAALRGVARSRT